MIKRIKKGSKKEDYNKNRTIIMIMYDHMLHSAAGKGVKNER
jgi:hypothetical protein